MTKKCLYHICHNFIKDETYQGRERKFCSRNCTNKYHVDLRRKKLKMMAVEYKGGSCSVCGYKKSYSALTFHHRNPEEKSFNISNPETRSWEKLRNELDKCDILCHNCHSELEHEQYQFKYQLIIEASGQKPSIPLDVIKS